MVDDWNHGWMDGWMLGKERKGREGNFDVLKCSGRSREILLKLRQSFLTQLNYLIYDIISHGVSEPRAVGRVDRDLIV